MLSTASSSRLALQTCARSSRLAGQPTRVQRLLSTSSIRSATGSPANGRRTNAAAAVVASAVACIAYASLTSSELRLDAPPKSNVKIASPGSGLHSGIEQQGVFLWGSNRNKVVAPDAQAPSGMALVTGSNTSQAIKKPRYLAALSGQAFRDLALHESYAVAVTSKGDLLQWGSGYSTEATVPSPTLKGQNIVQVALTPTKIYARTKGGNVLILPVSKDAQLDTSNGKTIPTISFLWRMLGYSNPGVHFVKMDCADSTLANKKIVEISAGRSHLLALTAGGRALCAAVDSEANEASQSGLPKLMELVSSASAKQTEKNLSSPTDLSDIHFDTTLKEIPSLRKLTVKQLAAGDRHSLALTSEGRVLAWGNNSLGQLALGSSYNFPTIPAPTEAALSASYPKATRVTCTRMFAGGDTSYFLVERQDNQLNSKGDHIHFTDLLASGNGMYGGLGTGQFFSSGIPVRVKTVSGLSEFDEGLQSIKGIGIHDVAVASTHAAVVLSNAVHDAVSKQSFGNDVFVLGHNADYQLGTGKRSNLATPQHIGPMPYPLTQEVKDQLLEKKNSIGAREEESMESGTLTHMPHSRLQLTPQKGKVEERIVCGYGNTAIYWHTEA